MKKINDNVNIINEDVYIDYTITMEKEKIRIEFKDREEIKRFDFKDINALVKDLVYQYFDSKSTEAYIEHIEENYYENLNEIKKLEDQLENKNILIKIMKSNLRKIRTNINNVIDEYEEYEEQNVDDEINI